MNEFNQSGNFTLFSRPCGEKSQKKKSRCTRNNGRVARKHPQNAKSPKKSAKAPHRRKNTTTNAKKCIYKNLRAYARKISPDAKTKKPIPMAPPGPSNRGNARSDSNLKPAYTVAELASARQHQKNWPITTERAVKGRQAAYPEIGFSAGGRGAPTSG